MKHYRLRRIDLTGQATAESLSGTFYFGVGGQADFMRGAVLAQGGKSILALPSIAINDTISRIAPAAIKRTERTTYQHEGVDGS